MLSGHPKFKQLRQFAACGALALGLAACASAPGQRPAAAARAAVAAQPLDRLTVATPDAEHDLVAQLMAGEMALTHTDLKTAAAHYGRAMALSDDPRVAERAAGLAIAVHDAVAAQRAIARWQALGATPAQLAQVRAQLALDQGDTAGARRQLELLVGTGDKDAWRQFGRVLLGARDQAQAAQLLEALATPERLPADPQAWLAMSEMGDKLGRPAYALRIADAAVRRFHGPETYAWAAQLKYKAGDHAGAKALLQQALARNPDNAQLRLAYAGLLSQGGDYAAAARLLDRGPQDADTYALRAALAAKANDKAAIARLYQQLQQAPDEVRSGSAYLLGQLAEMLGRRGEALGWYDQVGDDDEHAFDADLRSAVLLFQQGKRADAHALLEQLQTGYLDQPAQLRRAYEADAELYMQEQRYAQAADAYGRALQVMPDDPGLLYGRGLAYAEAGRIDPAVADFRRLLQIRPNDADASNALGYTLADANRDLPEAERLIEVARAAKPDDPAIADSWGWLQYRLGHLDQAAQVLRGAWAARKDADVGVHLGEVLWKLGRREDAERIFDQVRRLDPHNGNLQATLKRLKP
ncbi:tetratricopeptide repeat protein [Fulvimonas soli]|uniref:Tetratricopeptide repeat protein n=1 Tax=Fulvimonas soli TaxID=155197 RepID=A0A316I4Y2_9GAMM|nr:tetratricopeptide repeat protein [Fulvimonas soli]PWK87541.1 tetratricopeptide repeat protein [Fulvimonas soli]